MAKTKEISSSKKQFAKGGSGKMFGQQHAGPKAPGNTGKETTGDGGKWAKGGSGHMFGFAPAAVKKPGVTEAR